MPRTPLCCHKTRPLHFFQRHPTAHRERHLNTLVAMICGLVGAQRAHLSHMADHAPGAGAHQVTVVVRLAQGASPVA
jgi:hypothetical protein